MIDRRKKHDEMREIIRASLHKERDAEMLKFLEDKKPISTYVKKLIREDMKK